MPDDGHLSGRRGRRSRGPLHVPKPKLDFGPGPGRVIELQNDVTSTVEESSVVVGGQNNPIRIIYGRNVIGADIAGLVKNGADLVLLCVWGEGECDAIERYWINGADPASGMLANHYLGTATQGIDPLVRAACAASGFPPYTDTLPGICYSVFEIPPGLCSGFPQPTVLIRGRKVATTSGGAKTYSTNPAYCIADFIENNNFGMNRAVDWASVATVASLCDELVGSPSEKRHIFALVINTPQPAENWLAVMRDYASCWIVPEGDAYRLIADATGAIGVSRSITVIEQTEPMRVTTSVAHGFADNAILRISALTAGMIEANGIVAVARNIDTTHVDMLGVDATGLSSYLSGGTLTQIGTSAYSFGASNIVARTWRAQKASGLDAPTIVEVDYTNTSIYPWRTDPIDPVFVPGVYDIVPSVPFRRTRVSRPGTTRYSEARRYAIQLINAGQLNDLTVSFTAFDVGITLQVGDLIDVTHPSGITAKIMRLVRCEPSSPGRWDITATEHADAKYSSEVATGPAPPDTVFDSPMNPPTVTGLAVAEIVSQNASGAFVSQLSAQWVDRSPPAGTYPFVLYYRIDIFNGATLAETATVQRSLDASVPPKYVSGAMVENLLYTIRVTTISTLLAESAPAEATITNSGKAAPPSDVVAISAFEVAGEVHVLIEPATDLDLTAHEYRYGTTGSTWATATLLDRVATPSVRFSTRAIPAGTWRIYVKGLDSVRTPTFPWGQESVNAIYCDVVVTSDAGAFIAATHDFTTATTAGMFAGRDGAGNAYWITDNGDLWSDIFTSTLSTYTNAVFTYYTDGTHLSSFATDHFDIGALVTGTWMATASYQVLAGAAADYLSLSDVDSSYTQNAELSLVDEARWAYVTVIGTGCSLLVTGLGNLRVAVVGRSESGAVTTSASAGTAVNLANRYAKAISIQVTPATGATPVFGTYDNVVVGTGATNHFDAYAFNTAGTKVVAACTYLFTGI